MGPILAVVAVGSVLALAIARASSRPSPAGFALLGTLMRHEPPRRLSIREPGLNSSGALVVGFSPRASTESAGSQSPRSLANPSAERKILLSSPDSGSQSGVDTDRACD
jgi:hypothetical protein